MATGTGWPFGGPWVSGQDASKNIQYKIYSLKAGEQLNETIEFIQQPYLRAVANQVYEVDTRFSTLTVKQQAIEKTPTPTEKKQLTIDQLIDPIEANKNLQALAVEQVQFEKPLPLTLLMAYNEKGEYRNLTTLVDVNGKLDWIAPEGEWTLYALFQGWHGKMVERAGPGGEGSVIDHFSLRALNNYLEKFDHAFEDKDITSLRSFFNDSYEVDDAKGNADWTPALFEEFQQRRGYDLREHIPALLGKADTTKNERILCDYRETISEMLLENFTQTWKAWAHSKSKLVRNQAHGSPANILDLYATVDIPEIEGVEPLRIKMASSAGNVTGKRLVSSESATWLNEHFESNLADIKQAVDRFLLNGVNHIFYHGTSYSPPDEPWPGWLFYAAVHLNPRNPLWKDVDALNNYIARCQSFLQNSTADNDILLYYPIYDRFSTPGKEMIEHFDGIGKQFQNTSFERSATELMNKGYGFDFISDKQLLHTNWNDKLLTEGKASYQVLIIPKVKYIPLTTFQKIISLAEQGATIIFFEGLPEAISGFGDLDEKEKEFEKALDQLGDSKDIGTGIREIKKGNGRILSGNSIQALLNHAAVQNETMVDLDIDFIRKKENDTRKLYFISNRNDQPFEGWLPFKVPFQSAVIYDPMTGDFGKAALRKNENGKMVAWIRLTGRQTLFIETHQQEVNIPSFPSFHTDGPKIYLNGKWKVKFVSGGPSLPSPYKTDTLRSWTETGDTSNQSFSGTALYSLQFSKPTQNASDWLLDLGIVRESAEVFVNGKWLGKLIGPSYEIRIPSEELKETNLLEIQVTNGMANRIADLDKRNVFWKKFYNINFPARRAENRKNGLFDASAWTPRESGLIGPVTLKAIVRRDDNLKK